MKKAAALWKFWLPIHSICAHTNTSKQILPHTFSWIIMIDACGVLTNPIHYGNSYSIKMCCSITKKMSKLATHRYLTSPSFSFFLLPFILSSSSYCNPSRRCSRMQKYATGPTKNAFSNDSYGGYFYILLTFSKRNKWICQYIDRVHFNIDRQTSFVWNRSSFKWIIWCWILCHFIHLFLHLIHAAQSV